MCIGLKKIVLKHRGKKDYEYITFKHRNKK